MTAASTNLDNSAVFVFFSFSLSPRSVIWASRIAAILRRAVSLFSSTEGASEVFPDHLALAARDAARCRASCDMLAALRFPPILPPFLPISAITDFISPGLAVVVDFAAGLLAVRFGFLMRERFCICFNNCPHPYLLSMACQRGTDGEASNLESIIRDPKTQSLQ